MRQRPCTADTAKLLAISRVVLSGVESVSSYPGPTATTRDINPALSLPWYMYVDEAGTRTEIRQCTSKIVSIHDLRRPLGLMPDDLKVSPVAAGQASPSVKCEWHSVNARRSHFPQAPILRGRDSTSVTVRTGETVRGGNEATHAQARAGSFSESLHGVGGRASSREGELM